MTEKEKWHKIADKMARDNEKRRQEEKELEEYIKAHPGGLWDSLVE